LYPLGNHKNEVAKNTSVTLIKQLEERVALAMLASGVKKKGDFYRASMLDRCRKIEKELREINPVEYERLYGKTEYFNPPDKP
jgi:hypothetical protein